MKLEKARKLVKPELVVEETSARPVIAKLTLEAVEYSDQIVNDSEGNAGQKVFKVTRKTDEAESQSESVQKTPTKTDWKPVSKLRKNYKGSQTRFSRYKQATSYVSRSKVPSTTSTERSVPAENSVDDFTKSARVARYEEIKHKYVPKPRIIKQRGPKPSQVEGTQEDNTITTTKSPLTEKTRKPCSPRKSDKNHVEDIKAVALKLRKTLENMEKQQTPKPPRKNELEGSTTLLTTMRTVKSFSFSTRLAKMDESEAVSSSTVRMLDEDPSVSTSSSVVTEIVTLNPLSNEVTTPVALATSPRVEETTVASTTTLAPEELLNEIENFDASNENTTSSESLESLDKSTSEPATGWTRIGEADPSSLEYRAMLTNDTGSPVFVVYPSATEKPLVAITPKNLQYHRASARAELLQSTTQEPTISVKVSNDLGAADSLVKQEFAVKSNVTNGGTNIFSPARSAAQFDADNAVILDQLRGTVAPLIVSMDSKLPVQVGTYKNTNSVVSIFFFFFFNFLNFGFN